MLAWASAAGTTGAGPVSGRLAPHASQKRSPGAAVAAHAGQVTRAGPVGLESVAVGSVEVTGRSQHGQRTLGGGAVHEGVPLELGGGETGLAEQGPFQAQAESADGEGLAAE